MKLAMPSPRFAFCSTLTAVFLAVCCVPAWAHKARLDELGCHKERKTSYYHCHEGPLAGRKFAQPTGAKRALRKLKRAEEKPAETPVAPTVVLNKEEMEPFGPYDGTVIGVLDDGSLAVDVSIWPGLVQRVTILPNDADLPDSRSEMLCEREAAAATRAFVESWLGEDRIVTIDVVLPGELPGTFTATVSRETVILSRDMVKAGHAWDADAIGAPWCGTSH